MGAGGMVQLISYQEVMTQEPPSIDWMVAELIANHDRVIVYGEPGAMKSWLLLHLAVQLAAGRKWLERFDVTAPKRVLYIDEEMNVRLLTRRLRRLGVGAGVEADGLPLRLMSLQSIRFNDEGAEKLLDMLSTTGFDPEVIIVETLRRVMDGSENDAEDVAAFWRNLEPLRKAGKTIIISHHMRKPSYRGINDAQYRASGSTDIIAGTDTAIAIKKVNKGLIEVECVKSRNAEEPPNFTVRLVDSHDGQAIELRFDSLLNEKAPSPGQYRKALELIPQFLGTQPAREAKAAAIKAHVLGQGISESTHNRAWSALKKSNRVVKVVGQQWQLRLESLPYEPSQQTKSQEDN